jgi:hypothetical protein
LVTFVCLKKLQVFVRFEPSAMTRGLGLWPMVMMGGTMVV